MSVVNNPNRRTSVSIPEDLKLELDRKRGDVSSRFLLRILEKSHTGNLSTAEDSVKTELKNVPKIQSKIELESCARPTTVLLKYHYEKYFVAQNL